MQLDELLILFDGENELFVREIQEILQSHNIPSVHISSGHMHIAAPTELRVRYMDLEKSRKIIDGLEIKSLKEILPNKTKYNSYGWVILILFITFIILFFIIN